MNSVSSSWKDYFNVERVIEICSQFTELMNGWEIDGTKTKTVFDDYYRRKMKKVFKPRLCSSAPIIATKVEFEDQVKAKNLGKKDKKKKKKEKNMPRKEIIPAPKRRKELLEVEAEESHQPEHLKIPAIRISKNMILPKLTADADLLDVYDPVLLVTGRPSTQLHYAKLCRFAQKLKEEGRRLPFLLRNIVVEEPVEQQ